MCSGSAGRSMTIASVRSLGSSEASAPSTRGTSPVLGPQGICRVCTRAAAVALHAFDAAVVRFSRRSESGPPIARGRHDARPIEERVLPGAKKKGHHAPSPHGFMQTM